MQFSTIAVLLATALGISAAPTDLSKRDYDAGIPVSIWSGEGCGSVDVNIAYIPRNGDCFNTSPIFSGNTNSFKVLTSKDFKKFPAGCTVTIYSDDNCQAAKTLTISKANDKCNTFGANFPIRSAKAVGTCF